MTTTELLEFHDKLDERVTEASNELNAYCKSFRNGMGLVSDECRDTYEYQELNKAYNMHFHALRIFNTRTNKNKEYQKAHHAELRAKRMAKA